MKCIVLFALLLAACGPPDVPTATPPDIEIETQTFDLTRAESLPASGCAEAPASASGVSRAGHELMNRIRKETNLPCFNYVDQLSVAALRHSSYLARHPSGSCNVGAHFENASCVGFRGVTHVDRMFDAGLSWPYVPHPSGELVLRDEVFGLPHYTYQIAIDKHMNSLYHRIPIVDSRFRAHGFGEVTWTHSIFGHSVRAWTSNFGTFDNQVAIPGAHDLWFSMWPPPNTTGHYVAFDACAEEPSPPHPVSCEVGTMPSLLHPQFTPANYGTANGHFKLWRWVGADGVGFDPTPVPTNYLDKVTDPAQKLQDGVYFLVPHQRLRSGTWYLAQAFGNLWSGQPFNSSSTAVTIEWWFATKSSP